MYEAFGIVLGESMSIDIDRLTKLQKALKERKRTPVEVLTTVLRLLDFKEAEIKLYSTLLKKEMMMDEIVQNLNASERSARTHIKVLYEKGFVKRKVVIGDRLKYTYSSISPETAWRIVKKEVNSVLKQVDKILKNVSVFF
jgi:predicted DNA-binding transcriptional regulator